MNFEGGADDDLGDFGMDQGLPHRGIKLGRCQPAKLLILPFILLIRG
jgi:hypothetical protein